MADDWQLPSPEWSWGYDPSLTLRQFEPLGGRPLSWAELARTWTGPTFDFSLKTSGFGSGAGYESPVWLDSNAKWEPPAAQRLGSPTWGDMGDPWTDYGFRDYLGDVGQVAQGYVDVVNPVQWYRGAKGAFDFLDERDFSREAWVELGGLVLRGMMPWPDDRADLRRSGSALLGDLALAAPVLKRIPNPTPLELTGPFVLPKEGGLTLLRADWLSEQMFRMDVHRLPSVADPFPYRKAGLIPAWAQGRVLPHWHRRGYGGIARHRPFEDLSPALKQQVGFPSGARGAFEQLVERF